MIVSIIGRVIWVSIAYLISSFAAGLAFVVSVAGATQAVELDFGEIATTALFVSTVIVALAFVPAVVAVLIAEIFGFRNWLYYVVAGGIAALVTIVGAIEFDSSVQTFAGEDLEFTLFFMAPGLVAGLVYWVLAGRKAGDTIKAIPDSADR